jgi:DNA-3-methyladenine glycosylase II
VAKHIVNPKDIKELIRRDPIFSLIHDQYGQPPNWSRPPGFVTLSKIILEQQVSLSSAAAHFKKLDDYLAPLGGFTPLNILKLTPEEMRAAQISRQKAEYLRGLSSALIEKKLVLEELSGLTEPEVRAQLTALKGIGHWTCDIYLMFCLQSKDIFPLGDIAVINTVKELSKAKSRDEIMLLAELWRPLRSLAAYFLWHYYLKKRNRVVE